jgi:uncharacterized membrane protein
MKWLYAVYFAIAIYLFFKTLRDARRDSNGRLFYEGLPLFWVLVILACVFWPCTMIAMLTQEEM